VNSTKLQLELDEDIFVVNPLEAKAKIAELQAHGVKVALDNFGSGCCAFHQLQGIHFSQVKLVASYIDENHISAEAQTMLCALVQFASRLNYNVIAKQVETKLQLNKLIHAKCDGFQGYLFCRPLTEDDLIPLIKSHLTLNVV
jgi:EAL domain-containing protein (putative c-di-GMP-specific phosphodiesterase class I)